MNKNSRLFMGCFIALVATAFAFSVRGTILKDWGLQFDLSEEQKGILGGVGLYPFAISIILFSFIIDRLGYGVSIGIAFLLHITSLVITLCATLPLAAAGADPEALQHGQQAGYWLLYVGTFLFALGNGVVEAVINPVIATLYSKEKTKWLSILHAGWPGGIILGGLFGIAILWGGNWVGDSLPGSIWQWQMAIVFLPTIAYGLILMGQKFPVQERVEAGVSYLEMLKEFGWGSAFICCFLLVMGISQILGVAGYQPILWQSALGIAAVPTVLFAFYVRSFGRPMFVFLLLVMFLLATTELGTDSWIQDIMGSALNSQEQGILFLLYTSAIMFMLRLFAGPIVERISPLALLALSAVIAAIGLVWLASAGTLFGVLLLAATFYGIGKTFLWPATLGIVSEQYPKGGALMLNAISGVGLIAVGTIGGPLIGTMQDIDLATAVAKDIPAIYEQVVQEEEGQFFQYKKVSLSKLDHAIQAAAGTPKQDQLMEAKEAIQVQIGKTKQGTLAKIAILPAIMCVCYLGLLLYYRLRGGYKVQGLSS